jgi:tripartite-type tricarboxylate transporter receptor subunit TctC
MRTQGIAKALGFAALLACSGAAIAQSYPSKPIRVVVPYPGGSVVDVVGRLVADGAREALGQPMVLDHRGGASGIIGTDVVAKAPPDGYTILLTTASAQLYNSYLFKSLPYDPFKDFAAITNAADVPMITTVHTSVPVNSVAELVAYAKRNPGKLNFGSFGKGSVPHLYGELLKRTADLDMVHVPYQGVPQLLSDVSTGRVELTFMSGASVMPHQKSGKVKLLAINLPARAASLPDLPSLKEQLPRAEFLGNWFGYVAPAGVPPQIIQRLNGAIVRALRAPETRRRLDELYLLPVGNTSAEFLATMKSDSALAARIVKDAGITPE